MGHLTELMKINHKETYVQGWATYGPPQPSFWGPTKHPPNTHQTPTMHTSRVV